MAVVAAVTLLAGCSDAPVERSFTTESGTWVVFSHQARLVPGGGMDALMTGTLIFDSESGCVYLGNGDDRGPVLWPARTGMGDDGLHLSDGRVIPEGATVAGGGGQIQLPAIRARCPGSSPDEGVFAFNNHPDEISFQP